MFNAWSSTDDSVNIVQVKTFGARPRIWLVECLPSVYSPAPCKPRVAMHACNPTWGVEAGRAGIQGHSWLHRKTFTGLSYMWSYLKKCNLGLGGPNCKSEWGCLPGSLKSLFEVAPCCWRVAFKLTCLIWQMDHERGERSLQKPVSPEPRSNGLWTVGLLTVRS